MILKGGREVASVKLDGDRSVALARSRVGDLMQKLGSRDLMKTRFVTAVSEIARNAVVHGGGGTLRLYEFARGDRIGIECTDDGPGIDDIDTAMTDGYSTRGSLGRGLGGAKRLAKDFEIVSPPAGGTIVRMTGLLGRRA